MYVLALLTLLLCGFAAAVLITALVGPFVERHGWGWLVATVAVYGWLGHYLTTH